MGRDVLIVDDSAVIRKMITRTLHLAGLDVEHVHEASNGIEALARIGEHDVGVMLVDINMPTMNGLQLLRRMRGNMHLSGIPVVVITTEGSERRISELEQLGISGYLRKPFQPEDLRDVLKPILGVREDADTASQRTGEDLF